MTSAQRLEVYDYLRKMHKIHDELSAKWRSLADDWQLNAIDAVASVLYLAEDVFAQEERSA